MFQRNCPHRDKIGRPVLRVVSLSESRLKLNVELQVFWPFLSVLSLEPVESFHPLRHSVFVSLCDMHTVLVILFPK